MVYAHHTNAFSIEKWCIVWKQPCATATACGYDDDDDDV